MSNPLEIILNFTREDLDSLSNEQLLHLAEESYKFKVRQFHDDVSPRGISDLNAAITELRRNYQDSEYLKRLRQKYQTVSGSSAKRALSQIKERDTVIEIQRREIQGFKNQIEQASTKLREAQEEQKRYKELYDHIVRSEGILLSNVDRLLIRIEKPWKSEHTFEKRKRIYAISQDDAYTFNYTHTNGAKPSYQVILGGIMSEEAPLDLLTDFLNDADEGTDTIGIPYSFTEKIKENLIPQLLNEHFLITQLRSPQTTRFFYHIHGKITGLERMEPHEAKDKEDKLRKQEFLKFLKRNPDIGHPMEIEERIYCSVLRRCFMNSIPNARQYIPKTKQHLKT